MKQQVAALSVVLGLMVLCSTLADNTTESSTPTVSITIVNPACPNDPVTTTIPAIPDASITITLPACPDASTDPIVAITTPEPTMARPTTPEPTTARPTTVGPTTSAPASERLEISDFTYQGAFRLPSDFDWGARGMDYYPNGDGGSGSLLITGHDHNAGDFAQVSIPDPIMRVDWESLPQAEMLTNMTNFAGGLIQQYSNDVDYFDAETTFVSGIAFVQNTMQQLEQDVSLRGSTQPTEQLWGSLDFWYGVTGVSYNTIWCSEMDGSNVRGLYHVGPYPLDGDDEPLYHGNKVGDYLFTVPQWYADMYLGSRKIVTGKTSGANHGSQGPTLFAFRPDGDGDDDDGELDALPLLWYNIRYPECAGPNVGDKAQCDFPDYTMCDKWVGAGFVEGGANKRAFVLEGIKGLGGNGYGQPEDGACNPYQGYHCDPFERQVLFYDVDELGTVAMGERDAWTVVPYAIWRPTEFFLGRDNVDGHTCGEMGGMAVDREGGRVFMIEKGLGFSIDSNAAVVHVYSLAEAPAQ